MQRAIKTMIIFVFLVALLPLKVHADNDVYIIPFDSLDAYSYFDSKGLTDHVIRAGASAGSIISGGDQIFCDSKSSPTAGFTCRIHQLGNDVVADDNRATAQFPAIRGKYRYNNGYYDEKSYMYTKNWNDFVYIEFMSDRQVNPGKIWIGQYANGAPNKYHGNVEVVSYNYVAGSTPSWFHYVLRFIPGDPYYSIDFEDFSKYDIVTVIPIALKDQNSLSDIERVRYGLPTTSSNKIDEFKAITIQKFDELISLMGGQANNPKMKEAVQNLDKNKNEFDSAQKQGNALEEKFNSDLNKNIEKIDLKPKLLINSKFIKSMKWVSDIYTKFVVNTPFEMVLMFCLNLGISLVIIGKVRH